MRRLPIVMVALASLWSSPRSAAAAADETRCADRNASAAVACELARDLALASADPVVIAAAPATSDRPLRDGVGLSALLTRLVAGRVGPRARVSPPEALGVARSSAQEVGRLVYLQPTIRDGMLEVTADVHDTRLGFWDRIRTAPRAPMGHAYSERRLDAEVGRFLERPPLVALTAETFDGPHDVLALACGDGDMDGALEVAVVTRQAVQVGRFASSRFVASHTARWSELAPIAGVPLREPIGAVAFEGGALVVGISDRAHALSLTPSLAVSTRLAGQVPLDDRLCLSVRGTSLGAAVPCHPDAEETDAHIDVAVDATAWLAHIAANGSTARLRAHRDPTTETVTVETAPPGPPSARLPAAGAQLALGDLDLDGNPELLTSRAVDARSDDALRVHTLSPDGTLMLRLEQPIPGGIDAIATCPAERGTLAPVIVATEGGLLVLR